VSVPLEDEGSPFGLQSESAAWFACWQNAQDSGVRDANRQNGQETFDLIVVHLKILHGILHEWILSSREKEEMCGMSPMMSGASA